ncbi:hypothetical protein DNTS_004142 [Danionella cerebrum]|uniref:DUF4657 domain-containing protein n=1 Tax=Danionella cerebrum TaxID=2873325 RepID=A0A553MQN9_9TELE|nr:hypothetical protein DNTS_004142 [Danionella translucida]
MSLRKRKASMVFGWHKSFNILSLWRKGKGDLVLDNEVVLTKMKLNREPFPEKHTNTEDSISNVSLPMCEQDFIQTDEGISLHSAAPDTAEPEPKTDFLASIFSHSGLPRLYKFESEDSGVEMTSGATSPSTPTGSEQSFVVHSRESSHDSGHPNSALPPDTPLEDEKDILKVPINRTLGEITERREETAEDLPSKQTCTEACEGRTESVCPHPLRKSTTSNSLDEYMEECCRLSEMNQPNQSNPQSSGVGYLDHICQLIEKIAQLQEQNLRLQKQIYGLEKTGRVIKTKEDFLMLHCSCGAASLAFQELKRNLCSDHSSLTASSSVLSDLSTIPEVTRPPLPIWRRGLNRRSYTEGEAKYLSDSAELSENYTWGRVKELVKKTKLRNQSRLGQGSLKRSCPQLYCPDLFSSERPRVSRNSMIDMGHKKLDYTWSQPQYGCSLTGFVFPSDAEQMAQSKGRMVVSIWRNEMGEKCTRKRLI